MAKENRGWGYDRIAGALVELGYDISDQTVGNILKRQGLPPAPVRQKTTTWREFIRRNLDGLVATDFFSTEVWTLGGLVTFYVLFFIKLDTREVHIAGVTSTPNEQWMRQIARNLTMAEWGFLKPGQYLIHDRDTKFFAAFKHILDESGVKRLPLPAKSPNLNAIAERWIRSVKSEALSQLILFGERYRVAFNTWIRESGVLDGVVDFDLALRDPACPTQMLPISDCDDGLHPSDQGYCHMGDAIDLALFD